MEGQSQRIETPRESSFIRQASVVIPIALLAALRSNANAQMGKTRQQVKSELAEAQRTGNVIAAGDSGLTLRERHPNLYRNPGTDDGLTRRQVKAQWTAALRAGDVIAVGEVGETLREQLPQRYPMPPAVGGRTRQQVKDEPVEATRAGEILAPGEAGSLTLREQSPQRY